MRAWRTTQSFWRGVALVAVMLGALVGAGCGPSTAASALSPSSSLRRSAPQPLANSPWERIALPAVPTDIQGIVISPADPDVIFACAGRPLSLWRSTDAGATWMRYTPALTTGLQCYFSFAPDDPQLMTVQAAMPDEDSQACVRDTFYLSHDGGTTWRQLPPHTSIAPGGTAVGSCELRVTRHHLYLWYYYEVTTQSPQLSMLERSDDGGVTWTRADHGLGDDALYFMPEVGPGERLALTIVRMPATPDPYTMKGAELWTSSDAGQTWRQAATLPAGVGTFLWSTWSHAGNSGDGGQAWPTPTHPFYALAAEQIPSILYRERALMSADGQHWTPLPLLPVPDASADRPGILQALAPLPDGRLAIWGPDPRDGVPAGDGGSVDPHIVETQAFWLWLWSPTTQRWQVFPTPLPTPINEGCGLCWGAEAVTAHDGATYLYVERLQEAPTYTEPPGMFRLRLPAGA